MYTRNIRLVLRHHPPFNQIFFDDRHTSIVLLEKGKVLKDTRTGCSCMPRAIISTEHDVMVATEEDDGVVATDECQTLGHGSVSKPAMNTLNTCEGGYDRTTITTPPSHQLETLAYFVGQGVFRRRPVHLPYP